MVATFDLNFCLWLLFFTLAGESRLVPHGRYWTYQRPHEF